MEQRREGKKKKRSLFPRLTEAMNLLSLRTLYIILYFFLPLCFRDRQDKQTNWRASSRTYISLSMQ